MKNIIFKLPEYPVTEDIWDRLAREARPIVVYGMGNGADKLFDKLATLGVRVADIFASDGFVRGHSFRGMLVRSFSEITEKYDDFVILLSFASRREEVLSMLVEMDEKYDLLIPDMPVADANEYFDRAFYNRHYSEIREAYERLEDERSKSTFASIIRYKLTGRLEYLEGAYSTLDELYGALPSDNIRSVIDVGAYSGDTIREMKRYFPNLCDAVAIEPDAKTFKRLMKYADSETDIHIRTINAAAWREDSEGAFQASGNRNSSISATPSYENRSLGVSLISVDGLDLAPDYIKYDVEGAELEALMGSNATIIRHAPALLVSLYHKSKDIFSLINYLGERYPNYKMTLHRLRCVPAWEIDLILTPYGEKSK